MHLEIVYFDSHQQRQVSRYDTVINKLISTPFNAYTVNDGSGACLKESAWSANKIRAPNNNAFADFNGDCKADIFMESVGDGGKVYYEFWIKYS